MKQEHIFNPQDPIKRVLVDKFKNTKVNKYIIIHGSEIKVQRTPFEENICELCIFKEKTRHCPTEPGKKTPVCFAKNRPDRESVYFTNNEKIVLA